MELAINERSIPTIEVEKGGSELLWRKEDDKHILLARHDIYVLNEFSKEVLEMSNGKNTILDIANFVSKKYDVELEFAVENIIKFIEYAYEKKLVKVGV